MVILAVFLLSLVGFVGVGLLSALKKSNSTEDYLVASRQIHPWLMALAAFSTNNSGFMFIGLIGATYAAGLSSMWLMFGWIFGDWIAWLFIHRRLREQSERRNVSSVPEFLGWSPGGPLPGVAPLAALLTLAFLGIYAAAQLKAGNTALTAVFSPPAQAAPATASTEETTATSRLPNATTVAAVLLSAGVIAVYCFAGGLRASIWTNTAQAIVMIAAMLTVLGYILIETGGLSGLAARLREIDPQLMKLKPENLQFGFAAFIVSWIVAGIGVIGQPHIMTIAMSLDDADNMRRARRVYFACYIVFSAACILVGLGSRVLLALPPGAAFNQETALPLLAMQLLPDALVGLMLAGLFAATISTADTQILCCCGALTQTLVPRLGRSYLATKLSTLAITGAAAIVALFAGQGVFEMVVLAWSALASSLGPLLAVQAFGRRVPALIAVSMIGFGLGTSLFWKYGTDYADSIYEVLPGMAAGAAVYVAYAIVSGGLRGVEPTDSTENAG